MNVLFKKSLAVLLSAILLLTAIPFAATAAEVTEKSVGASSGTTGDCTWTLNNGNLTISGNGAMGDYKSKDSNGTRVTTAPWGTAIKTVVIEDGVTSIGEYAFYNCTGLTSVTIGNSVTSIGDCAFYNCTGLRSVNIPNSVTSISEWAFFGCKSLTSVIIGNSVTSIGYEAFYGCTSLTSVHISDIAAWCNIAFSSQVSNPLYYAHNLYLNDVPVTDLIIPDSVTSIGDYAFRDCTGLTSVTIPNSVTSIGSYAFSYCPRLTSVTIGNSVTSIGYEAFSNCYRLTSVTIGNSVTSIGGSAFYYCKSLTSVTIPDSVTSIGEYAFEDCTGLTSVYIPDSVTSIGKKALGYYYKNGYQKVAGFTIYGSCGSEAQRYANDNGFIFEEVAPEEPTTEEPSQSENEPAPTASLVVKATSNLFPQTVNAYNNLSVYEDGNGDVFVTVEYKLAAPGQYLINLDVEELSWDPAVLEFKEAYNKMGTGRQAKFTIFPFAYEQGLGAGLVNTFGDNNGGKLVGSYTSVQPAAYATEENGDPVTVVRAVFKVLDREAGETTVKLLMDTLSLCDDSVAKPYVQHRLVYNGVVDQDILDNCTVQTIIKPEGQVEPPVEETTEAQEETTAPAEEGTTEAYEETTAPAEEGTTEYYEATTCVPEYCTVSGISNYCPAVEAQEVEVGDTVTVSFKAPEDREIVDIQWGLIYDDDMLELTGINSFDNEKMLVDPNDEYYNLMGSYSNISTPASVAKDGEFVTFNFTVKQEGETTVDLDVVDMTIRIDGDDYIRIENGEIKNICTHKTTRTIPGYPATCTQAGLTDEIVCAECGKVLTKAEVISALGHLPVLDPYLAPTCSHEGHTAGSHCARCGEVYVASETIPKIPHTVVTDEAVEPSCGHTGLTEGSHCSVCGEVIVAQDVIPALKHQYEIVPAVPATYTKEGSTDGVRCKRCGEWLIAPQVIPKKPIDFTFGDVNEDGKVNIRDVTAIQRFLAEYIDLTERQRGAADVNFDGVVDVRDATLLQMYFAEFDVTLG